MSRTVEHDSDEASFVPDAQGWYTARCECGWTFGPLPSLGEVTDVLMEHAAEQARVELIREHVEGNR